MATLAAKGEYNLLKEVYIIRFKGWNYLSGVPETEEQQKLRFQIELEFVQCLGNPNYLNCKLFVIFVQT